MYESLFINIYFELILILYFVFNLRLELKYCRNYSTPGTNAYANGKRSQFLIGIVSPLGFKYSLNFFISFDDEVRNAVAFV